MGTEAMDCLKRYYPESCFGHFTDADGTITFYLRVNALLNKTSVVLDVGCGRGAYGEDPVIMRRNFRILKGKAAKVIGIDIDPKGIENPYIDEFLLLTDDKWPIEGKSVDLIVCDYVLEHVDEPAIFFSEIGRVLRIGGYICIRTTNVWGYAGCAARLIPNRYHARIVSSIQERRSQRDVFPTRYKCNSVPRLKKALSEIGVESVVYGYSGEPVYLQFSSIAYALGVMHQKLAPGFFKHALFAFGKSKASN